MACAAEVFVIAHAPMQLSAAEIKEIFLGEVQFAGSTKVAPIDNTAAQADFLARVLNLPAARYATLWTKKAFRDGLNAPVVKGTDSEVLAFVRAQSGSIGYVTQVGPGVYVVGRY